jgi:hypothetical protein
LESPKKKRDLDFTPVLEETPVKLKTAAQTSYPSKLPPGSWIEKSGKVRVPRTHSDTLPLKKDVYEVEHNKHIVMACNKVFSTNRSEMNQYEKRLLAGFASINPQISMTDKIALCIVLARYTLINQIELEFNRTYEPDPSSMRKEHPDKWSTHMNIGLMHVYELFSPSGYTLSCYVAELAVDQPMITSDEVNDKFLFFQEDGGHDGQDVKYITYWEPAPVAEDPENLS